MQYVQEAPVGVERVNGAVMSGQVESHAVAEEPEQALAVKRITEEHGNNQRLRSRLPRSSSQLVSACPNLPAV